VGYLPIGANTVAKAAANSEHRRAPANHEKRPADRSAGQSFAV